MPWLPYLAASGEQQTLLDKIVQRPKATWFGAGQPNLDITERVETYLELTTGGDPDVLAEVTIFRMVPWEREACHCLPTARIFHEDPGPCVRCRRGRVQTRRCVTTPRRR